MANKLKLGIIGISEGNGHPYSWSAIFNGYRPEIMKDCPFPAIPEYLSKQKFPESGLNHLGVVSHIWTQDEKVSAHIAKASNIETVVTEMTDMIESVDAILLARDDAENHYEMALPFLRAGIPIFIDKPLALTVKEAEKLLNAQQYKDQIFTCSALRFAKELKLTELEKKKIGKIYHLEGSVPKYWDTYAVHLIEPIITFCPQRGRLKKVSPFLKNGINMTFIEWENTSAFLKVTGKTPCSFKIKYMGEHGEIEKLFEDSYSCFKKSLERFILTINNKEKNIDRADTLEIVKIIEEGRI